jgi:hypothetical protein
VPTSPARRWPRSATASTTRSAGHCATPAPGTRRRCWSWTAGPSSCSRGGRGRWRRWTGPVPRPRSSRRPARC